MSIVNFSKGEIECLCYLHYLISFYDISSFAMPIFIFVFVFNSGLSEHPKTIFLTAKENWGFYLRLIIYNNILLPIGVWLVLQWLPIDPLYTNGLTIFFLTAGASTVIAFMMEVKLRSTYAVTSMILLTFMTVLVIPILLPFMIEGASITSFELVQSLVTSILLPLLIGMGLRLFFESFVDTIRPFILKAQKILLNVAIYGMMIGLIPELIQLIGSGVVVTGVGLVVLAFLGGYLIEVKNSSQSMKLTSGFVGGQKNGAVTFAVAINNFSDPNMILIIAVIGALSTVIFSMMSTYIGKNQKVLI